MSVVAAVTRVELLFVCQETDLHSGIQTVYRLQHPNQKPLGHVLWKLVSNLSFFPRHSVHKSDANLKPVTFILPRFRQMECV